MAESKAKARKTAASRRKKDVKIRDVMVADVVTIDAASTLQEVAEHMRDANVGMLPVMQEGALRGIITDRDLVVRAMSRNVRPSEARVAEFVSEPVRCAEPDWSPEDAMEEMARQQVGRLPVTDERGAIVGVVTLSSLALRSAKQAEALETAQDVSRRSSRVA
jgi:CBS domain-containing protein